MASEQDQEKTEEPSAKRLRKSREQGQIPRSRELTSALLLLAASLFLRMAAEPFAMLMERVIRLNLVLERSSVFDSKAMANHLTETFSLVAPVVFMTLGGFMLASVAGQITVGGWVFSTNLLAPKFNRMSPAQWLKRVFSAKGLMELLKSILKATMVAGCLIWLLYANYPQLINLGRMPLNAAIAFGLNTLGNALLAYAMVLVFISALDAPFQIWDNKQRLRMSRQELKDEHKQMEGSPEVKQRIRRMQREMANQRMMQRIPEADVVIVNPTHYSVALKYDQDRSSAPFVLAKGADDIAMRIRESANQNDVYIVEAPLLTRAVFYSTKIDQEIPNDLYLAVAQVLAYVYQLRQFKQGKAEKAPQLPELNVPENYDKTY